METKTSTRAESAMKLVAVRLRAHQFDFLHRLAREEETTVSAIVRKALNRWERELTAETSPRSA